LALDWLLSSSNAHQIEICKCLSFAIGLNSQLSVGQIAGVVSISQEAISRYINADYEQEVFFKEISSFKQSGKSAMLAVVLGSNKSLGVEPFRVSGLYPRAASDRILGR
jgi:hypothetical protein